MRIPHPNDPDLIIFLPPGEEQIPSWTVDTIQDGQRSIDHCQDTEQVLAVIKRQLEAGQEATITIHPYL